MLAYADVQYVALHGQLMEELPYCILPILPQRMSPAWSAGFFFDSDPAQIVSDRVLHLQTYLSALLQRPETRRSEALFEFLELNSSYQLLARGAPYQR